MNPQPSPWNLSDITPRNLEAALQQIERQIRAFEKERPTLTPRVSAPHFLKLIRQLEQLTRDASVLGAYAELHWAENSADQKAQALRSRVDQFLRKLSNRLLFFDLWFKKALPEKKARELLKASGPYRYHFEQVRKTAPYTLLENEEKIIQIKDGTGVNALRTVYDMLTSQFRYMVQSKELAQEEVLSLVHHASPKARREAYTALLSKYASFRDPLGEVYRNIILDWKEECLGLRGYKTPMQVRNIANDIPDKAVEALLRVCQRNYSVFQRYFTVKKRALKLRTFARFDLYAPISVTPEKKIPYHEALRLVLSTFEEFSPAFRAAAEAIVQKQHVHSRVQPNKRTGAFCSSVTTQILPYVLLSYTGKLRDVFTIAHELGHGVHDILAKKQTEFTFQATLPLAETASTFGEMLLSERLLDLYPEQRKAYLFQKLDDLYATIPRQAGFILFEKKAHEQIPQGCTLQELSSQYLADLRKQFGSSMAVPELFANEWLYISHIFHTPFYCYAYAFGNLFVLSLYEQYRREGKAFVPKMVRLLSRGGSASPVELTKEMGVDICSEAFWQQGFAMIERLVKEAERMV
ncbi:M3 family oligoendopeptidase [Candidatus Woesearchaeota archaeon]|nr:M3 family oligoendopeptidase [Candidatus Woesearchaeota archaeon]